MNNISLNRNYNYSRKLSEAEDGSKDNNTYPPPLNKEKSFQKISEAEDGSKDNSTYPPPLNKEKSCQKISEAEEGNKDNNTYPPPPKEGKDDQKPEFTYLNCLYTNAESLKNKLPEFKVRVMESNPDIIAVVETWLQIDQSSEFYCPDESIEFENYQLIRRDNPDTKKGGIVVYIKNNLEIDTEIPKKLKNLTSTFKDAVWMNIKSNEETILFGCIYRRPCTTLQQDIILREMIDEASKINNILICGDFNFKEIDWIAGTVDGSRFSKQSKFYDCTEDNFLTQHVDQFTRKRGRDKPSTLDLVFTKMDQTQITPSLIVDPPLGKSDHAVLKWHYLMDVTPHIEEDNSKLKKKNYYKGDYKTLKELCSKVNWEEALGFNKNMEYVNLESTVEKFKDIITEFEEQTIPNTIRKDAKKVPPWMNREVKRSARKKYFSYKRYQETRSYRRYLAYVKERDKAGRKLREAKRAYEKKIAKECKKNPKAFYRYTNFKKKSKSSVIRLRNKEGKLISGNLENAEKLNHFFQSVFTAEDDAQELIMNDAYECIFDETIAEPFDFQPKNILHPLQEITTSEEEVYTLLKNLDENKSALPGCIHPRILKEAAEELAKPITYIYNCSLRQGKVPDQWKTSTITPIHKNGDRHKESNYRPISITSVLCRTLEKIIRKHLVKHMQDNELLSPDQHGFTEKRSCESNLLQTVEDIITEMDKGMPIDEIYLDLAKAFDKVPHRRLLYKLKHMGINTSILTWIESFLTNRQQRVQIKGNVSTPRNVWSGVPQGSVLGPILFIIYINDLPEKITSLTKIFADDTKIYRPITSIEDADALQRDLDSLVEWCYIWKMAFNTDKCKVMHYGKKNQRYLYHMDGNLLDEVKEQKDLGVMISNDLKSESQVIYCVKRANQKLSMIKHTFSYIDEEVFLLLYKVFVRPILEYCQTTWAPYLQKDINMIENVQRRATKLVKSIKDLEYEDRLAHLKLYKLSDRRCRGDMLYFYKILNGMVNLDPLKLVTMSKNPYGSRGHDYKLQHVYPAPKTDLGRNVFSNRIVLPWNRLPASVVNSPTTEVFKSTYDTYKNL